MISVKVRVLIGFFVFSVGTASVAALAQQSKAESAQSTAASSSESQQKNNLQSADRDRVYRVKVETGSPDWWQRSSIAVAICALATSIYFSWAARKHNRLSVRPLPFIRQPDYENLVGVMVQNNGTGPLILRRAQATRGDASGHLISLAPKPPAGKFFTTFNTVEQPRAIPPGEEVVLVEIDIDDTNLAEVKYRDELRKVLGETTLTLEYTDIYNTRFEPYSRKMTWFMRHFEKATKDHKRSLR